MRLQHRDHRPTHICTYVHRKNKPDRHRARVIHAGWHLAARRAMTAVNWRAVVTCDRRGFRQVVDMIDSNPEAGVPVFFPGQLLELMRWAARYGKKRRNDGATVTSAECRERFAEAALIAGALWAKRVYGGKLTAGQSVDEVRLEALGLAQRRRGRTPRAASRRRDRRGFKLFTEYLPRHLPDFEDRVREATGLSVSSI